MRRHVALVVAAGAALLALAVPAIAHNDPDQHDDQLFDAANSNVNFKGKLMAGEECQGGMAGPYPCRNIDLASFVTLPEIGLGTGNDIWGWTDPQNGDEYAIMGTATGTGFVDVSDPESPEVVGKLPTQALDPFVLWRDVKVNGNFAFVVSENSGHGMQVFDLRRLRNGSSTTVFTPDAVYSEFGNAHNISINPQSDVAYAVGTDTCGNAEEDGGLHMVDISSPKSPSFLGCAVIEDANDGDDAESNNYVHDVECVIYSGPDADYQGREICFGSNENVVAIYDVTNKSNPQVISQTGYSSAAYTHQGSLTPDRRYFLFGDELDEQNGTVDNTTTYVLDVSDLDSPPTPKPFAHETNSIDHNLYTHGKRVYQSNYAAGLRILEYDGQSLAAGKLDEVAYFDVVPAADPAEFAGTWSNYRFPSGITVVSTLENAVSGMFVLRPTLGAPGGDGPGEPPDDGGNGGGGNAGDGPKCKGKSATIVGTGGDDTLRGTRKSDVIVARAGDDEIRGRRGRDTICAGRGADEIRGGKGRDRIQGGKGPDEAFGNKQRDVLAGGKGPDDLRGNRASDKVVGGPGADELRGGKGDDRLRGGKGNDRLRGGKGNDQTRQ